MPESEDLYQQQLSQDRAEQEEMQAKDRARQSPQKPQKINGIELAAVGLVAVVKDLIDDVATATIIGAIFTTVINVGTTLILWLWCLLRLHQFPYKRFIGAGALEFIPGLNALPFWTAFVVTLWLEQSGFLPGLFKTAVKKIAKPVST